MNTAETLERIITILPPKPEAVERAKRHKKLRVAAYCRVSTEQEEQQSSYEAQINYYTEKINGNAEWTLVGIFADEGITGTSDKKRTDFMRLMKLCEQGKVDLVLTKSISRFARNTLDCLKYIRMLKERGIPIIFEKENINTIVWRCMSRLEFGTKYCRNSPTMDEDKLQEAVTRALAHLTGDKADVASTVRDSVLAALGACDNGFDEAAALRRLDEAKRETLALMDLSVRSHDEEHFAKKFQELRDEMANLQAAVEEHRQRRDNAATLGEQAQAVMDALENETYDWTEYNDIAVRHLVSKITVVRFDRIRVQFKNGMEVEECVL